jgi:AcrR family transcriptional regulator
MSTLTESLARLQVSADGDRAATRLPDQILEAALDTFAAKGYHGATIREIAGRAEVSVAGLYHHFPFRRRLLERLMADTMDDLIGATEAMVDEAGDDPRARLEAAVAAHVRFHIDSQRESFVGNSELRSLEEPVRAEVVRKRDRQREIFRSAVLHGVREGVFTVEVPEEAGRALVTMCTAVAAWYRASGPLDVEEIVRRYQQLALLIVGYRPQPPGA